MIKKPLLDETGEEEKSKIEENYYKIVKNCVEMIEEMNRIGRSNNSGKIKPL